MESNAGRDPQHPSRGTRQCTKSIRRLRTWLGRHGSRVPGEFLQGMAYKLGSGAVTLLLLWWQSRH
ncbi:hypothetical protein [Streptomyces poonensis]|uniref:Uncharacterized protein n=1 Tax=Streptomyces poonensis TaxID=68255 RepID=A0A918UF93_9ACTN|nr:hypothetical protein [Streptomyces poonensis]GGZ03575.1 hypothetical protein GCM10010365_23050 [Streptomyces poonensis]GLJ90744.1 hypothetical protein GCM10017589_33490 [Streptomyces poonensis]